MGLFKKRKNIVILGDVMSGKTHLLCRLQNKPYDPVKDGSTGPGSRFRSFKVYMPSDSGKHHFIRLERVRVNREKDGEEFQTRGVIESREYYGLYIKYYITAAGQTVKVIEKNDGINIYEPGETVTVGIHPADIMSYPGGE